MLTQKALNLLAIQADGLALWTEAEQNEAGDVIESLLAQLVLADVLGSPWPSLSDDDWDEIEDGLHSLIGESAAQAEAWMGRSKEKKYRAEIDRSDAVLKRVQAIRLTASAEVVSQPRTDLIARAEAMSTWAVTVDELKVLVRELAAALRSCQPHGPQCGVFKLEIAHCTCRAEVVSQPPQGEVLRPAMERLKERFEKLRSEGLLDLKVWTRGITPETTLEELAEEMLSIFDAYERRDFVDITDKIGMSDAPVSAEGSIPSPTDRS